MNTFIVVKNPKNWPLTIPGIEVVSSKDYLLDSRFAKIPRAHIYNLSRSYRYQSNGYYVSLLAEARGHRPLPSISTLQDMRSVTISRIITEDLDELIQQKLKDIHSKEFALSIYFGKNMAEKYDRLALKLFNMFEAPLLRAYFTLKKDNEWVLKRIVPISTNEIPDSHRAFVVERAKEYFERRKVPSRKATKFKYDLAILHDPTDDNSPSNESALKKFIRAAEERHIHAELITRDDFARIAEYDALFIRATTQVNHYTYQFSRRADAEGLVVIDDPVSIIRCTNKIYLNEALERSHVPKPRTIILHKDFLDTVDKHLSMPCIIKLPDSSFSIGVKKAETLEEFKTLAEAFFEKTDLILVQEFIPTEYDWRIGIIDRKVFYACKYYMARSHWQVINHAGKGKDIDGAVEAVPLKKVPESVLSTALNAANLIGDGLYGVDLKEDAKGSPYIIEVNDNPSLEHGYEDKLIKDRLFSTVMRSFSKRLESRK